MRARWLGNDRHSRRPEKVENQVDRAEAFRLPPGETSLEGLTVHPPVSIRHDEFAVQNRRKIAN
jgi:hypothetical protein